MAKGKASPGCRTRESSEIRSWHDITRLLERVKATLSVIQLLKDSSLQLTLNKDY